MTLRDQLRLFRMIKKFLNKKISKVNIGSIIDFLIVFNELLFLNMNDSEENTLEQK